MVSRRVRFSVWWRRAGMASRLALVFSGMAVFGLLVFWQAASGAGAYSGSNVIIFSLVNLIIVILCVLAFLVGRNVVKLIFDRRNQILGAKLKSKLVIAFVGLTLVPTVILFVVTSGLLTQAVEDWFSSQVEASISSSLEVAKHYYAVLKEQVTTAGQAVVVELSDEELPDSARLKKEMEEARHKHGLYSLRLIKDDGQELLEVQNAAADIESFIEPNLDEGTVKRVLSGERGVLFEKGEGGQFVRAYLPVEGRSLVKAIVATIRLDPEITNAFETVERASQEYEETKLLKKPIRSSTLLTLALITALILFSAIWIAFYLAREIAIPIQRLAEGTKAVAGGNYDFQLSVTGDDELALLVRSFNKMTSDLKASISVAERRRLFIETILSHLAVGVIAIDRENLVTSVNSAAVKIFDLEEEKVLGKGILYVLNPADLEQVGPLIESIQSSDASTEVIEKQITVVSEGRELKIICTAGKITDSNSEWVGTVLLFDDVTELSKAQHMSAWREVARRIAHEIKNPLTPIQLSAQRLQRLVSDNSAVRESTETIVENVNSIKRLADEFSNFARMPTAEFQPANLNAIISDVVVPFAESHSSIGFQFIADNKLPSISLDPEQIRRITINLLDNAIAAIEQQDSDRDPHFSSGKIVIKTSYDRRRRMASFEIADNGPGIKPADKTRIFEPYFTTKKRGTGLGLAIVTSILSDHQGQIRVYDNSPRGAKFVVELPLIPKDITQRRFATG